MGIRIHKPGLLDTIQDAGRYGYQHWGINPGGVMDKIAMRVANMLVGNAAHEPVIEMHFPAAELVFEENALIALAGGDFGAMVNDQPVGVHHALLVAKGAVLRFTQHRSGTRLYLAVHGGFISDDWLGSHSTHLKVKAGGLQGRVLQKNDSIPLIKPVTLMNDQPCTVLPWQANVADLYSGNSFHFIPGAEYDRLDNASCEQLQNGSFIISRKSDRMGYRLQGASLHCTLSKEMISSAVTKGTMQLLPDGQLIILMADHQTTGGYPRIGHIISADTPSLSQAAPGQEIEFVQTDITTAETRLAEQERNLQQLQNACNFRLQEYLF